MWLLMSLSPWIHGRQIMVLSVSSPFCGKPARRIPAIDPGSPKTFSISETVSVHLSHSEASRGEEKSDTKTARKLHVPCRRRSTSISSWLDRGIRGTRCCWSCPGFFFLSFFFLIAQKERHEDLTAEDNRGIRRVFPQIDGGAADDTEAGDDFRFSSKWSAWRWNQRKSYFRNEEGRG